MANRTSRKAGRWITIEALELRSLLSLQSVDIDFLSSVGVGTHPNETTVVIAGLGRVQIATQGGGSFTVDGDGSLEPSQNVYDGIDIRFLDSRISATRVTVSRTGSGVVKLNEADNGANDYHELAEGVNVFFPSHPVTNLSLVSITTGSAVKVHGVSILRDVPDPPPPTSEVQPVPPSTGISPQIEQVTEIRPLTFNFPGVAVDHTRTQLDPGTSVEIWTGWERRGLTVHDGALVTMGDTHDQNGTETSPLASDHMILAFTPAIADVAQFRVVRLDPANPATLIASINGAGYVPVAADGIIPWDGSPISSCTIVDQNNAPYGLAGIDKVVTVTRPLIPPHPPATISPEAVDTLLAAIEGSGQQLPIGPTVKTVSRTEAYTELATASFSQLGAGQYPDGTRATLDGLGGVQIFTGWSQPIVVDASGVRPSHDGGADHLVVNLDESRRIRTVAIDRLNGSGTIKVGWPLASGSMQYAVMTGTSFDVNWTTSSITLLALDGAAIRLKSIDVEVPRTRTVVTDLTVPSVSVATAAGAPLPKLPEADNYLQKIVDTRINVYWPGNHQAQGFSYSALEQNYTPDKYALYQLQSFAQPLRIAGIRYVSPTGDTPLPAGYYEMVGDAAFILKPGSPVSIIVTVEAPGAGPFTPSTYDFVRRSAAARDELLLPQGMALDVNVQALRAGFRDDSFTASLTEAPSQSVNGDAGTQFNAQFSVRNLGLSAGQIALRAYIGYSGTSDDTLVKSGTLGIGSQQVVGWYINATVPPTDQQKNPVLTIEVMTQDGRTYKTGRTLQRSDTQEDASPEATAADRGAKAERLLDAALTAMAVAAQDYRDLRSAAIMPLPAGVTAEMVYAAAGQTVTTTQQSIDGWLASHVQDLYAYNGGPDHETVALGTIVPAAAGAVWGLVQGIADSVGDVVDSAKLLLSLFGAAGRYLYAYTGGPGSAQAIATADEIQNSVLAPIATAFTGMVNDPGAVWEAIKTGLSTWWDDVSDLAAQGKGFQAAAHFTRPVGRAIGTVLLAKGLKNVRVAGATKPALIVEGQLPTVETWGNPATLSKHFLDHRLEVGATSVEDYAQKASAFLRDSQRLGFPTKIGPDGIIRIYDEATNTFGAYNPDGTTATFFKPDPMIHGRPTNMDYWNAQDGKLFKF